MRTPILVLLLAAAVSASLFGENGSSYGDKVKGFFGETIGSLKKTLDKLTKVLNKADLLDIHKKIAGLKDKIKAKLALSAEEAKALAERLKLLKRKKVDKVQPVGDSIEEINMNSQVGEYLFQGDIVLTRSQAEEIVEDVNDDGSSRQRRQAFRDRRYPGTTWSKVPYFFDESASESVKSVFRKGAKAWNDDTCIDIFEETSGSSPDRIRVYMEVGCWSFVGRIGGVQNLSLGNGCDSIGTAAHELGHALGFFHTHSRHDRDRFITVNVQNIKPDWLDQFPLETTATNCNYDITYDPGSVMHYGSTSASVNKQPTMVPKDVTYTETLGSPFISFYDLLMLNRHYNCTEKCNPDSSAKCKMGGFPHPRDCKKCICPAGYGGALCNERPLGCGQKLPASPNFQTLKDSVGNKSSGTAPREDFDKCHYWLTAPEGKKIEVKLTHFSPEGIAVDGCTYAGVEIKTHKDQRLTGYRFCSVSDVGTVLRSESNVVPVITYNRIYGSDVTIEYRYF
ncbi:unnamed protein product [Heligmosomoides polygyrus]|uniref:Zinc metalloproteinase n=1 Tax=Heligmosomoides polygyrus TaxID=6339 RepID=A0A183G144_HELPZ|nr:unnamed protein product [Heligmosomoides polygyrus]